MISVRLTHLLSLTQAKVRDGQQIQSRVRALDTQYKSLVSLSSSRFASVFSFTAGGKNHLSINKSKRVTFLCMSKMVEEKV